MTNKFGQCRLCPAKSPQQRIYGDGVCAYHLNHPDDDQSKGRRAEVAKDAHKEQVLHEFFRDRALYMPAVCENQCGRKLPRGNAATWVIKSSICHILPKRFFESVMIHPLNIWYGCQHCHHDYDDKGWAHAATMKVWPICVDRFKQFMELIKDTELRHLPDALRILMPNPHP